MLETITKSESGRKVKLWLEDRKMMGSIEGLAKNREIREVEVQGYDCISFGTIKHKGEKTRVVTKINEDIKNFLEKAEQKIEELKEEERQEEAIFTIIKTKNSGWTPNWKVLDSQEKLVSDEQSKKIQMIRELLGEVQLFAGATKHINVDRLSVEVGETYTLTELWEMVKDTDEYKIAEERQQEKDNHFADCLEKAERTGKKVEVRRFTVNCNDPKEECSTDIITEHVTPDGRIVETRTHTY